MWPIPLRNADISLKCQHFEEYCCGLPPNRGCSGGQKQRVSRKVPYLILTTGLFWVTSLTLFKYCFFHLMQSRGMTRAITGEVEKKEEKYMNILNNCSWSKMWRRVDAQMVPIVMVALEIPLIRQRHRNWSSLASGEGRTNHTPSLCTLRWNGRSQRKMCILINWLCLLLWHWPQKNKHKKQEKANL